MRKALMKVLNDKPKEKAMQSKCKPHQTMSFLSPPTVNEQEGAAESVQCQQQ